MTAKLVLPHRDFSDRRSIVKGLALASGALVVPGLFRQPGLFAESPFFTQPGRFAEELALTPSMTEGPFFPDRLPLDTDNDLLVINDAITPAVGEVTHLTGRILNRSGEPVRGALVELWQVDNNGSYLHSRGANHENGNLRDANFQGYGRFLTDQKGQYYFRTIKPVPYPGRTPHVHFSITVGNRKVLSTQMLIKGHAMNARDGLLRSIREEKLRELLLADFQPLENSKIGELAANFDMVIGQTPEDKDHE